MNKIQQNISKTFPMAKYIDGTIKSANNNFKYIEWLTEKGLIYEIETCDIIYLTKNLYISIDLNDDTYVLKQVLSGFIHTIVIIGQDLESVVARAYSMYNINLN